MARSVFDQIWRVYADSVNSVDWYVTSSLQTVMQEETEGSICTNLTVLRPSVKQSKIRAIMPLKVIQGHQCWYQSKVGMRLPISD